MEDPTCINLDYVFCLPGESFSSQYLSSWTESLIYLMKNNIKFACSFRYTCLLAQTRNELIRYYPGQIIENNSIIPFEKKLHAKKIIFIDDDVVWTVEDLKKILESDKDIVGGFYKMKLVYSNQYTKLAATQNGKFLYENDIKDKKELIELSGIGFGFIAINFEVFEKIKFPWFESFNFFDEKNNAVISISEDMDFCNKAISNGYKIYGDPTVRVGHEKIITLGFKNE
jgi:hypothetical protein